LQYFAISNAQNSFIKKNTLIGPHRLNRSKSIVHVQNILKSVTYVCVHVCVYIRVKSKEA